MRLTVLDQKLAFILIDSRAPFDPSALVYFQVWDQRRRSGEWQLSFKNHQHVGQISPHRVTLTSSSTAASSSSRWQHWHGGAYFPGRGAPIRKGWAIPQHEDWNWTFHWKPPSHLGKNLSYQIWLSQSAAYVGWVNDTYMSFSWRAFLIFFKRKNWINFWVNTNKTYSGAVQCS